MTKMEAMMAKFKEEREEIISQVMFQWIGVFPPPLVSLLLGMGESQILNL